VILAIDTTHECGSIALLADGELLEELSIPARTASGTFFRPSVALLARHGRACRISTASAAAAGPGSFTGVR